MNSADHIEIFHTSRQLHCRDAYEIRLCPVEHILNKSTPNFDRISNSIELSLVGLAPGLIFEYEADRMKAGNKLRLLERKGYNI